VGSLLCRTGLADWHASGVGKPDLLPPGPGWCRCLWPAACAGRVRRKAGRLCPPIIPEAAFTHRFDTSESHARLGTGLARQCNALPRAAPQIRCIARGAGVGCV